MKKTLTLAFCVTSFAVTSMAQTAETAYFQGLMTPLNEVPAVSITDFPGAALGTVIAHVVRDSSGKIVSGTLDFLVDYRVLAGGVNFTGLHIHKGAAGVVGPIVLPTDVSASNPVKDDASIGRTNKSAQVLATDAAGVDALNGLFADPSQFYINLHNAEHPGGVVRAQLQRADVLKLMGFMSPLNETPPITDVNASGVALVTVIATRGSTPETSAALVMFDVKYNFPAAVVFTGFHIHRGAPGVAGAVVLNTGIGSGDLSVNSDPSGSGVIHREFTVSALDTPAAQAALADLFTAPQDFYINLHTTQFGGGIIRAPLRTADEMVFSVNMLPGNETPPITGLNASAPARVVVNTLRGDDGTVSAAAVTFDVNYRFPAAATFNGLHLHEGAAGVAGPVTVPTDLSGAKPVISDSGVGDIMRLVILTDQPADKAGLATINTLLSSPEKVYINIHTTVNPGGAVRAQLGAAAAGAPAIAAIISAVNDKALTTLAPGELITIYGVNLARNIGDLRAFTGRNVPTAFNGVQVTIGGRPAPLIFVSPGQINAEVPFETPAGATTAVVTVGGVASASFPVTVAPAAPGIFFDNVGGIVVNQDFSLVRPENRVRPNDVLVIYATGLGQTTPAVTTGRLVEFPPQANTATVTATIGGQPVPTVIYSIASPQFTGLYQVAIRVPTGIPTGDQKLVIRVNGVDSNAVNLAF